VTSPAIRITACAGLLTAGLLFGGIGGGVAVAEPCGIAGRGDSTANTSGRGAEEKPNRPGMRIGARQDRGAFEVGSGGGQIRFGPRGIRGGLDFGPVRTRFGVSPRGFRVTSDAEPRRPRARNAEAAVGTYGTVEPGDETRSQSRRRDASVREGGIGGGARHHQLTIRIPIPQVLNGYGIPDHQPQNTVATVVVSVSTGGVVAYVEPPPEPTPEPWPEPGFRIQGEEDEPPVVEPVSRGGGSEFLSGGLPPLEVPAVVAPPPMLVSPPAAPPAVRPPAVRPAPPQVGGSPGAPAQVPGALAAPGSGTPPAVRGGAPGPAPPSATGAGPRATPAARPGYRRYPRNAQLTEMLAFALPGVAGMFFMTFSGGVIGYRQANAWRMLRRGGFDRFLP
jgi:hypothetical protein